MTSAADLLWTGTEVFERRHEKSAQVLLALQRTLDRERPLAGGEAEFCALASSLPEVDPGLFTQVWSDPSAYRWARIAFQLLAATLRGTDPPPETRSVCEAFGHRSASDALRRHLGEFKRFVLALDHLRGFERKLETPLRLDLPYALPGTPLCLDGAGSTDVWTLAGARLRACPTLDVEGCRTRLQPEAFHLPGVRFADIVLEWGAAYQAQHRGLLEESLRQVARFAPDCFGQLREVVQVIALKPLRAGDFSNTSLSDLPGAFVVAVIENPYELADSLIHEFHHDRLFAIEEQGAFFTSAEAGVRAEQYYSPWRHDPRSLQGILHAVYVHQPVWRFWRNVLAAQPAAPHLADYARDRLLRFALQIAIGVDQLERHARFTEFGAALFAELRRAAGRTLREVESVVGSRDVPGLTCSEDGALRPERGPEDDRPLSVRESLAWHARRFSPPDQAGDALAAAGLG